MTNVRMFEQETHGVTDSCEHCRWFETAMCPNNDNFIGRTLFDVGQKQSKYRICHRFVLTNKERERRWQQVLDKLHENIVPEENNWPF